MAKNAIESISPEKVAPLIGKVRGANSCKYNRAAKLANQYTELIEKFGRMAERGNGLTEYSKLAICSAILLETGMRIGNLESAEGYITQPRPNSKIEPEFAQTYGLITLTSNMVEVKGKKVIFNFTGKARVENQYEVSNPLVVKYLKQLKKVRENNQATDEPLFGISDYKLNKFIQTSVGKEYSAKDFRTMKANVTAIDIALGTPKSSDNKTRFKKIIVETAEKLSHTPTVCKKSYLSPTVVHFMEIGKL